MTTPFSEKLRLVLKMLSMSSAQLAAEVQIDKSVVSRWLKGTVQPSSHNLARLSAVIAARAEGFRMLDWERSLEGLAQLFGADPTGIPNLGSKPVPGLPIAIWDQMISTSALRAAAYEGFFRSTRPHPTAAGQYLHEHGMIRRDDIGLPRLDMGRGGTVVSGWMLPLYNQLYCIAADITGRTLLFGIFNGLGDPRVDVFDGVILIPGRDPLASIMICERIGDLSGDREADDRRFAEIAALNPLAPEGSVPEAIRNQLLRDVGPDQLPFGGDFLLQLPPERSMARGSWST